MTLQRLTFRLLWPGPPRLPGRPTCFVGAGSGESLLSPPALGTAALGLLLRDDNARLGGPGRPLSCERTTHL